MPPCANALDGLGASPRKVKMVCCLAALSEPARLVRLESKAASLIANLCSVLTARTGGRIRPGRSDLDADDEGAAPAIRTLAHFSFGVGMRQLAGRSLTGAVEFSALAV